MRVQVIRNYADKPSVSWLHLSVIRQHRLIYEFSGCKDPKTKHRDRITMLLIGAVFAVITISYINTKMICRDYRFVDDVAVCRG